MLKKGEVMLFQDESTFYQSGLPRKRWARKGTTPTLPIYGTHSKLNVFGFINPFSGQSHFQYIKKLNADCFIEFLNAILKEYPDAEKVYIILDNAPAHRAKKVDKFANDEERLELIKLPPYSPDLNPIETVWREVKKEAVYNTFYRYFDDFKTSLTHHLRNFEGEKVINVCNLEKYIEIAS